MATANPNRYITEKKHTQLFSSFTTNKIYLPNLFSAMQFMRAIMIFNSIQFYSIQFFSILFNSFYYCCYITLIQQSRLRHSIVYCMQLTFENRQVYAKKLAPKKTITNVKFVPTKPHRYVSVAMWHCLLFRFFPNTHL